MYVHRFSYYLLNFNHKCTKPSKLKSNLYPCQIEAAMSLHFEKKCIVENKSIMVSNNSKETRWNLLRQCRGSHLLRQPTTIPCRGKKKNTVHTLRILQTITLRRSRNIYFVCGIILLKLLPLWVVIQLALYSLIPFLTDKKDKIC